MSTPEVVEVTNPVPNADAIVILDETAPVPVTKTTTANTFDKRQRERKREGLPHKLRKAQKNHRSVCKSPETARGSGATVVAVLSSDDDDDVFEDSPVSRKRTRWATNKAAEGAVPEPKTHEEVVLLLSNDSSN